VHEGYTRSRVFMDRGDSVNVIVAPPIDAPRRDIESRMRTLFVNHTSKVSGAELSLLECLRALPYRMDAVLACPEGELSAMAREQGTGVSIIPEVDLSFHLSPLGTPAALTKAAASSIALRRVVRRVKPDTVEANSTRAGLLSAAALTGLGIPLVVGVKDVLPRSALALAVRWIISIRAGAVVGNSEYVARAFRVPGGRARLRWVYPPVDLRRFNPAAVSRRDARAALGLPHDKLTLGVVGQVTPWKGHDDALRLVASLRREFPDVLLVIVGEPLFVGPHTRYDNRAFALRLQEMVKELGIEESVRFAGPRPDIPAVMRALDVLLAPSWLEPFGRVVVEAMAMGTAVIASDAGGPREIITDGVDGFLCPPRRPDRWVTPTARLLRDASLRARIGSAARKRASDFRLERHVVGVLEVHEDVLAQARLGGVRPISIGGGVRQRGAEASPRVLVLTPDYPPTRGGIQVLMHRVVSHWQRLEPLVVTLGSPQDHASLVAEYPAHRVKRGVMGHQADIARLNVEAVAAAFKFRPDAVLCGHIVMAPAAIAIGRAFGVPVVQYLYAQELAARPRLTRVAIRRASAVIAVSAFTSRLATSIQPHPRVSVIPPGVDVPPPGPCLTPVRHGAPTIITVARLVDRYKGHDVMLRALPLVVSRISDARWIVVGDGPLRGLYERMADEVGVREHVVFRGEVDDVERDRLLDSADVFVMVSRVSPHGEGEGFGIVYLEAGAHGLPVVAGRSGGAPDAVIDGVTGILVDPTDHVAVAGALIDVLTHPETGLRMGRAGRAHATEHTWQRASAEVESLLLDVIARHKRA